MKKPNVSEFRLMLAVGICVMFFTATPKSHDSFLSCYEHEEHGSIDVTNPNIYEIKIQIHNVGTFTIPKQTSRIIIDVEPGEWAWKAWGDYYIDSPREKSRIYFTGKRPIMVEKNKVSYLTIPLKEKGIW